MRSRRARVKEGRQRRKGADGAAGPGGRRRVAATGAGWGIRAAGPSAAGRAARVCLPAGRCPAPQGSLPPGLRSHTPPASERGACRPSAARPARVLRYKGWRVRGESLAEAHARMAPGQPDPGRNGQASLPPPQERNARSSGARPGLIAAGEGRPSVAAGPDLTPPVWAAASRTRAAPLMAAPPRESFREGGDGPSEAIWRRMTSCANQRWRDALPETGLLGRCRRGASGHGNPARKPEPRPAIDRPVRRQGGTAGPCRGASSPLASLSQTYPLGGRGFSTGMPPPERRAGPRLRSPADRGRTSSPSGPGSVARLAHCDCRRRGNAPPCHRRARAVRAGSAQGAPP